MYKEVKVDEEYRDKQRDLLKLNIEKANSGDEDALGRVFKSLDYIINSLANKYYIENHTVEDIIQVAKIAMYEGMKNFDFKNNKSPKTFLKICAEREILDKIKYSERGKRKELIKSWSLDAPVNDGSDKNVIYLKDMIEDDYSLERIIEKKDLEDIFEDKIYSCLSDIERKCIQLHLEGYSNIEKASMLNITSKQADNAIQRVYKKLRKNEYAKELYLNSEV